MRLTAARALTRAVLAPPTRRAPPRRPASTRAAAPQRLATLAVRASGDASAAASAPSTVTLRVTGMVCSKCSDRVATALAKVDGVTAASADHAAGTARAQVAPGVTGAALAAVVTGIGFEATAE